MIVHCYICPADNHDRMEPQLRTSKKPVIHTIFNTDGVDPFKSSDIKVWPIYLAIWNLPPPVRMLKKNLVTCAFLIVNSKHFPHWSCKSFRKTRVRRSQSDLE